MNLLTTNEAAKRLNVTPIRVRQMIREGKINARRIGRDYIIAESALDSVKTYRKTGRPTKSENGNQSAKKKPFKTIFDVAPHLVGSIKSGLPGDLSTNKEYLRDLGKKSVEKKALRKRNANLNDE